MAERADAVRRRQRLGRRDGGPGQRHGLRGHGFGVVRLVRRQPPRRQPVCRLRSRAGCAHRQARVALPGDQARPLGLGHADRAKPGDGDAQRQAGAGGRAAHQARLRVRARPQDRRAVVPGGRAARAGIHHRRRASRCAPAASAAATAVHPAADDRGDGHHAHARGACRGAEAIPRTNQRSAVHASHQRLDRLPWCRRWRRVGRRCVRSRYRAALRQRQRDAVDHAADPQHRHRALWQQVRVVPPFRSNRRTAGAFTRGCREAAVARRHRRHHPHRHRPHARLSRHGRQEHRRRRRISRHRKRPGQRCGHCRRSQSPEVPQRRGSAVARSRWLPANHATVGYVERP